MLRWAAIVVAAGAGRIEASGTTRAVVIVILTFEIIAAAGVAAIWPGGAALALKVLRLGVKLASRVTGTVMRRALLERELRLRSFGGFLLNNIRIFQCST